MVDEMNDATRRSKHSMLSDPACLLPAFKGSRSLAADGGSANERIEGLVDDPEQARAASSLRERRCHRLDGRFSRSSAGRESAIHSTVVSRQARLIDQEFLVDNFSGLSTAMT
ncbi:hypothetical protein OZ411_14905 [Bradyrhizobium sp. Arg237L]|uniref:hypothetical protein n=1 Tax=Bradyrhizobium sp. Arg237L TaxID=3003352 RepID=UPI00249F1123|nr:hypothetical protein [Bradyrhizobium sp. Arg237L]MDI4234104.1 hypothetical protein [Bradyrhizobium sp. Arg237L]